MVWAAHRAPPTAALAIACIACANTCTNRAQIHTLQHPSGTRALPNLTMRHFTTHTHQTFQTLPTLSTHSPPSTYILPRSPHEAPGSPTMSLSTTLRERGTPSNPMNVPWAWNIARCCLPTTRPPPPPVSLNSSCRNSYWYRMQYNLPWDRVIASRHSSRRPRHTIIQCIRARTSTI